MPETRVARWFTCRAACWRDQLARSSRETRGRSNTEELITGSLRARYPPAVFPGLVYLWEDFVDSNCGLMQDRKSVV